MRIQALLAKSIGPFKNLEITFKPKPIELNSKAEIHILTGENGTGKSTILMMLASCADFSNDKNLIERFHNNSELNYEVLTDYYYFDSSRLLPKVAVKRTQDTYYSLYGKLINHTLFGNHPFDVCFFGYSSYRSTNGRGIINIKEIIGNPLEDAISFEKPIDSDLILDWIANVRTKELIAKGKGNNKGYYISTVQKIEKALTEIIGKKVEFDLEETLKISIIVNGVSLNFNTLPDGLKSIISWLSDLLMRLDRINWADKTKSILEQNFILFLDEIEVHLHPSWQRKILPVVQDLFPNAQIFISTHSPFVVGSVDGARVYKFKLDENNNSVLDSEYLTEDGNSYDRILEEIFDIKERFGVGVQKQLDEFKEYKTKILKGETVDEDAFMKLASEIAKQSIELNGIISFELRQLKRNTTQKLETA